MIGVPEHVIVPLDRIDMMRMLEFWRWMIPETDRPLFATALGDLFLVDLKGRILWLDMSIGEMQIIAADEVEFERFAAGPVNRSTWFGTRLVDQLRASGKVLQPGECYSYLKLPMLGGEYEVANFRIYDVITHFRVWGPIHEKLRDIPDGVQVEFRVVNPPDQVSQAKPGA
jgi:hypothetical protein